MPHCLMPDTPAVVDKVPTGFSSDGQATAGALWKNPKANQFVTSFYFSSLLWRKLPLR